VLQLNIVSFINVVHDVKIYMLIMSHNGIVFVNKHGSKLPVWNYNRGVYLVCGTKLIFIKIIPVNIGIKQLN